MIWAKTVSTSHVGDNEHTFFKLTKDAEDTKLVLFQHQIGKNDPQVYNAYFVSAVSRTHGFTVESCTLQSGVVTGCLRSTSDIQEGTEITIEITVS